MKATKKIKSDHLKCNRAIKLHSELRSSQARQAQLILNTYKCRLCNNLYLTNRSSMIPASLRLSTNNMETIQFEGEINLKMNNLSLKMWECIRAFNNQSAAQHHNKNRLMKFAITVITGLISKLLDTKKRRNNRFLCWNLILQVIKFMSSKI